jgi:hypothetical protein
MTRILTILLLSCLTSFGATWYVQPGATGEGTAWGADAYGSLPNPPTRGDTYWIGSGTVTWTGYTGVDCPAVNIPLIGSTVTYIKKATISNHGTSTGWSDTYAGVAHMPRLAFSGSTGYITIDGGYQYGFDIAVPSSIGPADIGGINLYGPDAETHVSILNTYIHCPDADGRVNYWLNGTNIWGVYVYASIADSSYLTINNCKISGFVCSFNLCQSSHASIVSNELAWAEGTGGDHSDICLAQLSDNVTVAYNWIHDFNSECFENYNGDSGWSVIDNIVYGGGFTLGSTARFLEFYSQDYDPGNGRYYNRYDYTNYVVCSNTLVNLPNGPFYASMAPGVEGQNYANISGSVFTNNIYYGMGDTTVTGDYNWIAGNSTLGETHSVAGGMVPPFIDTSYTVITNSGGNTFSQYTGTNYYTDLAAGGSLYLKATGTNFQPTVNFGANWSATNSGGGGNPPSVAITNGLSFSATNGVITSPMQMTSNYVFQPFETDDLTGGTAFYWVNITNTGSYTIAATVNAPAGNENSFFIGWDGSVDTWDVIQLTSGFESRAVSWRGTGTFDANQFTPKVWTLTAGVHQLQVYGREASTLLQWITVTSYTAQANVMTVTGTLTIGTLRN